MPLMPRSWGDGRRDSAALVNEEANRFIGRGTIGTKDGASVTILWRRALLDPTDLLLSR